jgi:competence protein ComEA
MVTANRFNTVSVRALLAVCALAFALQPALAEESKSGFQGVVNVNTASADELQLLPGIGEARAAAIVDIRKARGGFKSVDELTEVKGIGDAMLENLRPHVVLQGKTTAHKL